MGWFSKKESIDGITDEQAMWRVQTGDDHEAFAELVRRWESPVRALCIRMTGDERRGEDLTQEIFARVFTHRSRFDQNRKFSTWIWRIALNRCHDENRHTLLRGESPLELDDDAQQLPCAPEPAPDEQLMRKESVIKVRDALQQLPETHRAVIILREYEGLKMREIAEVLGIPEGTAKSRLADALTKLGNQLRSHYHETTPDPAMQTITKKDNV